MSALAKDETIDGKYRIVRLLGKGAWASVYEGVNIRLHRRVAIKVLGKEQLTHPGIVERFEREGQAATQIESDHVVDIFDIGTLDTGQPYMVMEFLDGEDLGKVLESRGPLSPELAVFYTVQGLKGLAAAHAAGVLHRDIKPANVVLVTKNNQEIIKIVDFGISKLHSGAVPQPTAMTQTNAVLGSPVYMSPEQCRGARLMDHRSDLYSLGVVLYEALTGKVPHVADSFNALMFKIALEDVPDPRQHRADLDAELVAIVMKALARDAEKRFQSAVEFHEALVAWANSKGIATTDWPTGSVRNISIAQSGSSPKASLPSSPSSTDEAKATKLLKESGERETRDERAGAKRDDSARAITDDAEKVRSDDATRATTATEAARSRTPMIVAVLAGVAVVLGIAIWAMRSPPSDAKKDTPPPPSATVTATAAATTATATATASATAEPSATASAAASASATTTATAPAQVATTTGGGRVHSQPQPSARASATAAVVAPAASASAKATVDGRTIHTNF